MEEQQKGKLESILSKHKKKQDEITLVKQKKEDERKFFLGSFKTLSDEIIRPAMEEIGETLMANGHGFYIMFITGSGTAKGYEQKYSIQMQFYPNEGHLSSHGSGGPSISFIADPNTEKVVVHESTMSPGKGGHSGSKTLQYVLNEISTEIIQKEVIATLDEILNG